MTIAHADLLNRDRPKGRTRNSSFQAICGRNVREAIYLIMSKLFQVVKLDNMHALIEQKIFVNGNDVIRQRGIRPDFKAAGIGSNQYRAFLFDEPLCGFQRDTRGIVLRWGLVIGARLTPVVECALADQHDVTHSVGTSRILNPL